MCNQQITKYDVLKSVAMALLVLGIIYGATYALVAYALIFKGMVP